MFTLELIQEIHKKLQLYGVKDIDLPPLVESLTGDEILTVVKDGVNVKMTVNLFLNFDMFTTELIAILQGPAFEAAAEAYLQANFALTQGNYARDKGLQANSARVLTEQATIDANLAASNVESKGEYAEEKGDYARDQGAYAFAQGEYANSKGLYAEEKGDYANAQGNFANTKGQYANAQGLYAKGKGDDALIAKELTEQATIDTRNIAIFAGDKADEANQAAILANNKAGLADTATIAANDAAILANQKAGVANNAAILANEKAEYANAQGDYAKGIGEGVADNEFIRRGAENRRLQRETDRRAAEELRDSSETSRINAEGLRDSAESSRRSAEVLREQAKADTIEATEEANTATGLTIAAKDDYYDVVKPEIIAQGEYATAQGDYAKAQGEAIQGDLALKANQTDFAQLADEVSLLDAVQSAKIKDIENVLSTANLNQSAQLSVSGVSPLSLPKNAANGGMSVRLEGLTEGVGGVITNFEPTGRVRSVDKNGLNPTALYLTAPELRSNGTVKDEIRKGTNGYELVKRVGVGTLGGEIINQENILEGFTSLNAGIIGTTITTTGAGGRRRKLFLNTSKWYKITLNYTADEKWAIYGHDTSYLTGLHPTLTAGTNVNLVAFIQSPDGGIYFRNPYSDRVITINSMSIKEVSTQDVIAIDSTFSEIGSNIHYTLATPVITPISYGGILNSAENGTVYHEPIIADAGVYDTKMDILLTDYPIDTIEEIIKHENGIDTYLNVATAVIAGDGLSFTHPNLASGDLVLFTYAYDKESTNGNITASFYDSNVVKIDTVTGKAYRINEVVTNGVLTRTLTEV